MVKRGADVQLTQDDGSGSEDGSGGEGNKEFKRASAEELSKRKIVKLKKRSVAPKQQVIKETAAGPAPVAKANPFGAGFSFAPSSGAAAAPLPLSSNGPGSSFASFASSESASTSIFKSPILTSSSSNSGAGKTFTSSTSSTSASGSSSLVKGDENKNEKVYRKKMEKLNNALMLWMDKQMVEHPTGVWKKGLEDYVKHAEQIEKDYPISQSQSKTSVSSFTSTSTSADELKEKGSFSFGKSSPPATTTAAPAPAKAAFASGFTFGAASAPAPASTANTNTSTSTSFGSSSFGSASAGVGVEVGGFSLPSNAKDTLGAPTFGMASKTATTATSALPSFGATASTGGSGSGSAIGFSFASTNMAPPAHPATMSNTNNGFGKPPTSTTSTTSAGGLSVEENGDEVLDAKGLEMEASKKALMGLEVLKNEDDKDEVVFETNCRLKKLGEGEWKDMGKGSFKVTRDPDTKKMRMLVRDPTIGKIKLNAAFFNKQTFTKRKVGKNEQIAFSAVAPKPLGGDSDAKEGDTELCNFLLRVADTEIDGALAALQEGLKSVE